MAYPYIPGSRSAAFQSISIFLGVMFSIGSSSFIANIIAGYSMTYRRAFRLGDRIQVGDVFGDVSEIRLQVTHVRSVKNEEIVVPNSTLLNSNVVNYSALARTRGLILHTTVGIGYETPWRQVEAMLLLAAERTPGLLREPAPFVLQKSLGDFCVVYEINVYCDAPAEMARLYTRLHQNILDVFNEYGVQIMTPAYEGDPEQPKVVPKDQWWTAPAQPVRARRAWAARRGRLEVAAAAVRATTEDGGQLGGDASRSRSTLVRSRRRTLRSPGSDRIQGARAAASPRATDSCTPRARRVTIGATLSVAPRRESPSIGRPFTRTTVRPTM